MDAEEQNHLLPKKKKSETEDDKRRKRIVPGSLLKAVVRPGGGDSSPKDGDQIIYHCTVRTLDGVVVESTRSECGGRGLPIRDVLGKSKMILGLLEGIPTMHKAEIAMFKMKPEMHYAEKDCPVSAPGNFPKDDELHFEIELLDFAKAKARSHHQTKITIASDDLGVVKKIVNEGEGWESPREPYEVKARISAKSGDGQVLLSPKEEPYFFTFGKFEVPKGLEIGIGTMARKEKAVIYVRKQYLTESPLMHIAHDLEEVHFEVELVHFIQVRDMLGDGRLIKRRIRDGRGEFPMDCPLQDSRLSVRYRGMLLNEDKTVFYDSRIENGDEPLEFSSGEGLVPEGFEMCTRLMLPGEIALVTCPPDYAYDKFPRPPGVPEGAHVQWEIELLGFETPRDWTGLDFQSIMNEAENIRCTGNRLFKEGKFELAKAKYEKVLREFNHVNPQDDEEGKVFGEARNMLHLNVAACLLKLGEWRKSVETCNKVLEAKPGHAKGLYRRGMAYMGGGEYEAARNDFNMMIKVDKSSEADASAALLKLKQKEQEAESKARKQFKGLFDKKPGEITEAGSEIREETKTREEVDETKDNEEDDETQEEESMTTVSTDSKWSEKAWPIMKNVMVQIGIQLGLWKRVCSEITTEIGLLAENWNYLLAGLLCQYIHGLAARGVHYIHRPGPTLQDLGYILLPELGQDKGYISETVFTCVFISFLLWTFHPFIMKSKKIYTVLIWCRVLAFLVACQFLRVITFYSTQLPGPNYHCREGSELARLPRPHSVLEVLLINFPRGVIYGCGDLIFSSHMIFTLVFVLTYQKYGSKRFLKLLGWVIAILQSLLIVASRKHYTVDVVVAWYTVNLVVFFLDKKLPELPDRTTVLLPLSSKDRTKEENHNLLNGNGVDPTADRRPRAQVNGKIYEDSNGVHTDNATNGA
ncbi:unnamed protein product [Brassica oleracea var. botrytis]